MTKRNEVLAFARINHLQVKGSYLKGQYVSGLSISAYNPSTKWADCFDSWEEVHTFFLKAVEAKRDHLVAYPWDKKAA